MTTEARPTEPLRSEHRDLLPHLCALDAVADQLDRWDQDAAVKILGDVVAFLRDHLVPHTTAEERVLYPAAEQAMAAASVIDSLRAEHIEIVARIDRLVSTVDMIPARWSRPNVAGDLGAQLLGLASVLRLHVSEEEDVLLPVLDGFLAPEAATSLFARMAEVAHS